MEQPPSKKRKLDENNLSQTPYDETQLLKDISNIYELFDNKQLQRSHLETLFENILNSMHKKNEECQLNKNSQSQIEENNENSQNQISNSISQFNEFAEEQCIASFDNIRFDFPKGKIFIEIFPSYMSITQQSKKNQQNVASKSAAPYRDIKEIILLPYNHNDCYLYIQFNKSITLSWRKTQIDCISMTFEDESIIELKNIQHINLPNELRGTTESILCQLLTKLSTIPVQTHNKQIFVSASNPKKYNVEGSVGANHGFIYPLENGIFILCQPKLIQFVELKNIESYEYANGRGMNTGLRYFDFNINLRNCEKSIQISMIPIKEISSLQSYFSLHHINCVESKEKKNKNFKSQVHGNGDQEKSENVDTSNNNNRINFNNKNHSHENNANLNKGDNSSDDSSFDGDEEESSVNQSDGDNDIDDEWTTENNNQDKSKLQLRNRIININDDIETESDDDD